MLDATGGAGHSLWPSRAQSIATTMSKVEEGSRRGRGGGGARDCMCEVGQPWFRQAVEARAGEEGERVVLLATGAMNPVHKAHINMFTVAKQKLEGIGKVVVAGVCSPSHDYYVQRKVSRYRRFMWAAERVKMVDLALHETGESSWVTVGVWESLQSRFIDFPHVAAHYAACLALHFPDTPITLAFLCGTDHIKKCRLENGVSPTVPVVGIGRKKHELRIKPSIAKGRYLFLDDSHALEVSSTAVRAALKMGDGGKDDLTRMLHSSVRLHLRQQLPKPGTYDDKKAGKALQKAWSSLRAAANLAARQAANASKRSRNGGRRK